MTGRNFIDAPDDVHFTPLASDEQDLTFNLGGIRPGLGVGGSWVTGHGVVDRKSQKLHHRLPTRERKNLSSVQGWELYLDLQHHMFLLTFDNKLGLSPPNLPDYKPSRVLDLGTGTGLWAIDFGDEHPEAEIIGVDLSPIQPSFVPPNVQFLVDDIDEEWNYSKPFDYIHSRMMNFSIQNWAEYLQKMFQNLTPGGYVELQEMDGFYASDDGTLSDDHALSRWCTLLGEAAVKLGRSFQPTDQLAAIMKQVGFNEVVETRFKWPINRWPKEKKYKELGAWNNQNASQVLESATLAPFTRVLGWSSEEVNLFLMDVRKDLNNPDIHAYSQVRSVYGRKPQV
ncbi:hypothetical protein NCS57_01183400 [Fusarium keratoplasticum]|uniref:Uncharacterized protein n=1 Tax=Fusarium keratoplasticum TaxID=1328300 RepID=A0ACC0QL70_9HYPO|nr:hypothetical protein NCS57_01183400 [Fusarium keratoplasticum]KAI8658029.1 hypothetical protein NCS57_01183400 [Fusarium keratoplasticum]